MPITENHGLNVPIGASPSPLDTLLLTSPLAPLITTTQIGAIGSLVAEVLPTGASSFGNQDVTHSMLAALEQFREETSRRELRELQRANGGSLNSTSLRDLLRRQEATLFENFEEVRGNISRAGDPIEQTIWRFYSSSQDVMATAYYTTETKAGNLRMAAMAQLTGEGVGTITVGTNVPGESLTLNNYGLRLSDTPRMNMSVRDYTKALADNAVTDVQLDFNQLSSTAKLSLNHRARLRS